MSAETQTWLGVGYAAFLLGVAFLLDWAARRVAVRSAAWRSGGFRYHPDHDAWQCPQDQWLWPQSFDPHHRVVRYRSSPLVCNACPVKRSCTTSSTGREVSRAVDSWPSSEAERFHRGIACAVAVMAVIWPLAVAVTRPNVAEVALLAVVALAVALGSWPLWSHLRRTPAGFPQHLPVRTLEPDGPGERRPPRHTAPTTGQRWGSKGDPGGAARSARLAPPPSQWRPQQDAPSSQRAARHEATRRQRGERPGP